MSNFTPICLPTLKCSWSHTLSRFLMYCSFDNIGHADMMYSTVSSNCWQSLHLLSVSVCNIFAAWYFVCNAWPCAAIIYLFIYLLLLLLIHSCLLAIRRGLLVNPDLNIKSKRFTPALTERCVQCSLVWSSVTLWPTGDVGATGSSDLIPSQLFPMLHVQLAQFLPSLSTSCWPRSQGLCVCLVFFSFFCFNVWIIW